MKNQNQFNSVPTLESVWAILEETAQLQKKTDQKLEQMYAESRREMKELNSQLGGIANSNGDMAEAYFYNSFKAHKVFAGEQYDYIQKPTVLTNGKVEAEFDMILFNGKSAVIIEVKYRARPNNIDIEDIIAQAKLFRIFYPERRDYKIYLGVAAMSFQDGLEKRLHSAGIATIRQIGKKMVVYDKEVKAF
ncbi:MAG: hypothetical protein FWF65_03345 [Bacteroidetes bacterium]|nr:hypothetical protein [Bacteroidota bacterium]